MSSDVSELERVVSDLPTDWKQTTLGNALARSEGGGTPPRDVEEYWNGDIPWASVKDVVKGVGSKPEETITPAGLANSTSKLIAAGTNIFAARMGVGAVVRYPFPVAINQDLMALTPSSELDPGYLFYWLQARKEAFGAVATGTTVKGIRKDVLLSFPMILPPLDEQRRIAEVLRSVDEAIAAEEAALDGLRNVANAVIEERCRAAESDGSLPIGDFATFVGSGVTPKGGKDAYVERGIAFIRSQNVHFDGLRDEGLAFIDAATDTKMARTRVQADDVLLNITGASIGRCTIVPKGFGPANVNQHVCIIRPDAAVVSPAYLSLFLSSFDGQRQIDQLQGGLSREGLNFKQVRAIIVPTPSLEVQAEIAKTMGAIRSTMRELERVLARKQALRSGISTDLLSGRVRVPA